MPSAPTKPWKPGARLLIADKIPPTEGRSRIASLLQYSGGPTSPPVNGLEIRVRFEDTGRPLWISRSRVLGNYLDDEPASYYSCRITTPLTVAICSVKHREEQRAIDHARKIAKGMGERALMVEVVQRKQWIPAP